MKAAALGLLIGLSGASAGAGTLQVTVPTHHTSYPSTPPAAVVMSAELDPKPLAAGEWSLRLTDETAVLVPLSVSASPSGSWVGSTMTFDVPYFVVGSGRLVLAAPVVDDPVNTPSTDEFVQDAAAVPALEDTFLLNARAHRIWEGRRGTIDAMAMGKSDAKVVFWLLQSETTLVEQTHLRIDTTVRSAVTWMNAAIADPNRRYLFGPGGVKMADAKAVLAKLNARGGALYALVINRLGADVGSPVETVRKDACRRLGTLVDFYRSAPDSGMSEDPDWRRHATIVSTRSADCTGRAITEKLRRGEAPADEDVKAAGDTADRLWSLAAQTPKTAANAELVRQAQGRVAELRAFGASR